MVIDDALHDRQAQTGTAGTAGTVAAYKRLEQMLTLLRFDARTIILDLEPGAMWLCATANLNPAITIAGSIDHHIGNRAFDRQRMHLHLNEARLQRGINLTFITAFCRNDFS
ncbi:hypothetical protein D3C73_1239980 [compost metagenome]